MRIAVVHKDRCHSKKCGRECIIYCPRVRTGDETIVIGENGKAIISEELCVGCGICIKKCPFDAIDIITLPEELEYPTHRYGVNGFALYGMAAPVEGKVTGILGENGIGKSTAVSILSGQLIPNLGNTDEKESSWDSVLEEYSGTELHDYLTKVSSGNVKVAVKPQYIDFIPKVFKGKVISLLKSTDERNVLDTYINELKLGPILDRDIDTISGGELQRVAIAACLCRKADFYFLDEITPYLDIYQRMAAAKIIRDISQISPVMIVEHDLAILDMLADNVHVAYGKPSVFGIITRTKGVRVGINQYLEGFLAEENVRFRDYSVTFETRAHRSDTDRETLFEFPAFKKSYGDSFRLNVKGGTIKAGEVLGVVGANGIGKSTFAKLLAGVEVPDEGKLSSTVKIAFKPQYIKTDSTDTVEFMLRRTTSRFDTSYFLHEIIEPLSLEPILQSSVSQLSGGELQRVAIALCLAQDADLYILDEPSAHLDVEQRVKLARVLRRHAESSGSGVLVIDHDIYVIDMISERLLVFDGTPGVSGEAVGPFDMHEGMNYFLKELEITFRRDKSGRPRINKPGSYLDREQRSIGSYYYSDISKS
ncbi:ribosome biogenesis/translation initiation ATPase RLI [Methanomicrobium antiquum]|uniref:Ribosome biogenesis/translation initiation ATPase RLI n=1 Tax=Methanomicrobium antiquum TaxID=487686 RepID=A0AAF0JM01_9EURY|nr:ribosome biogenesis/translation initiation ATPase RLI [Methanomicrobium antiquum]MDD3976702.1 ribosome biogenesis/translation initiation ATPase RLI [Methanomicrobium sp.]WFN35936.1 ribosome biogenesis/translation initiation ATPase RLI [Methanomicrobium antiquum]